MQHSTEWLIRVYTKYVGWIAKRQENWETFAWEALIARSLLEERESQLQSAEREQIAKVDKQLNLCRAQLSEILPAGNAYPRTHWWWYMHEDAHVRSSVRHDAPA